ncbi:hypothetical protein [Dactylosporangium sp. NPDC049140]|jgi:hypothetical protein|uniref:hypothetical protein n=1 Tax=Dactylosporangium sp. NPDC049140 TaxID=3155647 RepID=UPI003405DB61
MESALSRRVKRYIGRGVVVAAVVVGALSALAEPASATPSGCSSYPITWNGVAVGTGAFCTGGSGSYRAWVTCDNYAYTRYGPWKSGGATSYAYCDQHVLIGLYDPADYWGYEL